MISSNTINAKGWHILGAGAIGCLWASHLSRVGQKVTLLLRSQSRLKKVLPLKLEEDGVISSIDVFAESGAENKSPIGNLIVCTKSFDALLAIRTIQHRLTSDSLIVLLFNGMGVQQECAKRYPDTPIICGSSSDGAYRRARFHVVQAGKGQTFFGLMNPTSNAKLDNISANFMTAIKAVKLSVSWSNDILECLWRKLAVNCAINPLTAIHRCRNGDLLKDPSSASHMRAVCDEIETILSALKLPYAEPSLHRLAIQVAECTAQNYSSMYQDVINNRPTEIDQINGFICQLAKQLDVPVPTNEMLYQQIKTIQQMNRSTSLLLP